MKNKWYSVYTNRPSNCDGQSTEPTELDRWRKWRAEEAEKRLKIARSPKGIVDKLLKDRE